MLQDTYFNIKRNTEYPVNQNSSQLSTSELATTQRNQPGPVTFGRLNMEQRTFTFLWTTPEQLRGLGEKISNTHNYAY